MSKKRKLTFKEYYDSLKKLKEASNSIPRVKETHILTKYCKFPVMESADSDERLYVSFKPRDEIEVLWEYDNDLHPTPKQIKLITMEGETVYPCWNNRKMNKWIRNNTIDKSN